MWPTGTLWSFKNAEKVYGSPLLDAAIAVGRGEEPQVHPPQKTLSLTLKTPTLTLTLKNPNPKTLNLGRRHRRGPLGGYEWYLLINIRDVYYETLLLNI